MRVGSEDCARKTTKRPTKCRRRATCRHRAIEGSQNDRPNESRNKPSRCYKEVISRSHPQGIPEFALCKRYSQFRLQFRAQNSRPRHPLQTFHDVVQCRGRALPRCPRCDTRNGRSVVKAQLFPRETHSLLLGRHAAVRQPRRALPSLYGRDIVVNTRGNLPPRRSWEIGGEEEEALNYDRGSRYCTPDRREGLSAHPLLAALPARELRRCLPRHFVCVSVGTGSGWPDAAAERSVFVMSWRFEQMH